jgi:hypothetical protein
LIAVWTQLDPLPLIVTQPALMAAGFITFGVVRAAIYRSVAHAWPPGIVPRALRMAFVLFASFAFWEFFTPFNQFGEPFPLIALELSFWAVIALAEAFTLAASLESEKTDGILLGPPAAPLRGKNRQPPRSHGFSQDFASGIAGQDENVC